MEESREFYTLTDEDGNEIEFELIGSAEIKGVEYFAMIPADAADKAQEEGGFCEYVILRVEADENGESTLVSVDDDEEFDDVADLFDDMFRDMRNTVLVALVSVGVVLVIICVLFVEKDEPTAKKLPLAQRLPFARQAPPLPEAELLPEAPVLPDAEQEEGNG